MVSYIYSVGGPYVCEFIFAVGVDFPQDTVSMPTDIGNVGPIPPANGYVAEDGTTYYVAEDGATYYVQES